MVTPPDNMAEYAFGWERGITDNKWDFYGKSGVQVGARAYFRTYPEQNLHIAILSNTESDGLRPLTNKITRLILK